jgi:hypothetical protein
MTELLAKAFTEAGRLPESDQDTLARWLLEEMESERMWQEKFAASADLLRSMAKEAIAEDEAGETEELDPDSL